MPQKRIPGTPLPMNSGIEGFALFRQMISAAGGLSLSQVCALTGLEGSTVQNWVKRGYVAKPVEKKYQERQLARILIISALKNCLQIEQIAQLLSYVNGSVEDGSDDIIGEALLYDTFCSCIKMLNDEENGTLREKLEKVALRATKTYRGPYPEAGRKLRRALCVMMQAYEAANMRREAELMLWELQG